MIKNWLISAWLASPLAGDAPMLDGILQWEMSLRLGAKHAKKLGKWTRASEILDIPIPIAKRTINGHDVFCCSSPILPPLQAPEWVDRTSKRFESSKMAQIIDPMYRKNVATGSGAYKSRFAPERIRLVDRVCWFVRGDRKEIKKILKDIHAIGKDRNIGYGFVWQWTFDEMAEDYSIFAPYPHDQHDSHNQHNDKQVLMRTIPLNNNSNNNLNNICGYKLSFGGYKPPYWHPAFQMEIAVPC